MDIEWQQNRVELSNTAICSRYWKYILMICIIGLFFIAELISGIIIRSLVVQADAFHMLSDVLALIIALISFRLTFLPSSETATFGYKRADVIGGLINGVYLLSTCFFISIDVIQRFANLQDVARNFGNVNIMLIIGSVGVAVNILGVILFSCNCKKKHDDDDSHDSSDSHDHGHHHDHGHNHHDMNVKALLLHMFGDILGSLSVVICGLIIKFVNNDIKYIADPIASLVIVVILIFSAVPIIKQCYSILAQRVPIEVDLPEMRKQLMGIDGIVEIHDFHVWQLTGKRYIGSVHVKLLNGTPLHETIDKIQRIMHDNNVHATTIQPEMSDVISIHRENCNDIICDDKKCKDNHCCD
jgi:zinc transporter 1